MFLSRHLRHYFHAHARCFASAALPDAKIVVVGAGSAGLTVATQAHSLLQRKGMALKQDDVVLVDAAEFHYYQPGWTLVGSGLLDKTATRRPLKPLIPTWARHIKQSVTGFSPETNRITLSDGSSLSYDFLIVAAGLKINWSGIKGLQDALVDSNSGVSSIYSYETCDKAEQDIAALRSGRAIFTQPAGVIKCAGAPQKVMWQAWDRYKNSGRGQTVQVEFWTGMPSMFSVKKYSDILNALRISRDIPGRFEHNLISIDVANRKATFRTKEGDISEDYTILHVVPPQGPLDVIKSSPLADSAGWVDVDQSTLQHKKFKNVFSLGDASSLPTSKTAAAITAQAPVLVHNLVSVMEGKNKLNASYDGYTSCPLLTGEGKLLLAEFRYGLEPKETFAGFISQDKPQKLFYTLKTKVFPAAYWNLMLKGTWYGPRGLQRPTWD